jgi:hypothetical protein
VSWSPGVGSLVGPDIQGFKRIDGGEGEDKENYNSENDDNDENESRLDIDNYTNVYGSKTGIRNDGQRSEN